MSDDFNPEQLKTLLSLDPERVLMPFRVKKEDVGEIKAIKLSDQEVTLVHDFQDFLFNWGYLQDYTFESLFIYIFNLAGALHEIVVEHEAQMGRTSNPGIDFKSQD